jgi:protein-tyrosine phosphatase
VETGQRHVPFEACFNFRDIGGYETIDGRRVRWSAVFRSDALHRLTARDLELAEQLGVRTVIDLRTARELETDGRFGNESAVAFHHVPLEQEIPIEPPARETPEPPPGVWYAEIATAGRGALVSAFTLIAESEHAVVFHCAAGKDRTGILAALLLSSLGVPDEVIVADYHLSERSLGPAVAWAEANEPKWAKQMAAFPPWTLQAPAARAQAFLDILRERHGSIDAFLTDAGIDHDLVQTLRTRLLET